VLGERHLHDGYDVVYISAEYVREVVEALRPIDQAWLRRRYDAIDEVDYRHARDDADFAYTWGNFVDIQAFYTRAAAAARAVIFTTT